MAPPAIEKLNPPPLAKPPKKPDRMYSQYITNPTTPRARTKLQTLRGDTENLEACKAVEDLIEDNSRETNYSNLKEALETRDVGALSTYKTLTAPATTSSLSRAVNNGLDIAQPPISDIQEIFLSITQKAMALGLKEAMEEFVEDGAGIRIVTMCSGTESPIIGMNMIQQSIQCQGEEHFKIRHLGSCEIEPYKQAFIERNFGPPVLLRDVTEFTGHKNDPDDVQKRPRTAYGAIAEIPKGAHILIAGSSCVDHSALNNHANKIDGESAQTLLGVADYADLYRPVLVLLENVAGADWEDQHVFWADRDYYFRALKIDSKNFYLPQTRERGYSVAIDMKRVQEFIEASDLCNPVSCGTDCENHDSDLCGVDCGSQPCNGIRNKRVRFLCEKFYKEWRKCMEELQQRASSPYTDFLLKEDDARLHAAKAMTENTKPSKQNNDWKKCQKRHTRARAEDFLGSKRPFTNREGNGRPKLHERYWGDWFVGRTIREQDVVDISVLRNASARGLDTRFKSRTIDITQNIDRDVDSRAWGLVGCVTPSGCLFETRRGGPVVGLEALALQGMPIDNLDLTKASLRQMQDLAGNAMTTTVITSSILSAFIASYTTFALPHTSHESLFRKYTDDYLNKDVEKVGALGYDFVDPEEFSKLKNSDHLVRLETPPTGNKWEAIIIAARKSQLLCQCENLGQHTNADIKYCRKCSYTCCVDCSTCPHDDFETLVLDHGDRGAADVFISSLTQYLPGIVKFSYDDNHFSAISKALNDYKVIDVLEEALEHELQFQGVKHGETWKAVYESQNARLELDFPRRMKGTLSHLGVLDVRPTWWLFAKCPAQAPVTDKIRTLLKHPIAKMCPGEDCFEGIWEFWDGFNKDIDINIKSVGPLTEAWEAKLGLQGNFYPKLKISKRVEVQAISSSYNTGKDTKALQQLDGTYKLLEKCPAPYGWLYVREKPGSSQDNSVFFYLNASPIGEPADDRMEFGTCAPSITSTDDRNLLLRLDEPYIPTVIESTTIPKSTKVQGSLAGRWTSFVAVKLERVDSSAELLIQPDSSAHTRLESCGNSSSTMFLVKMKTQQPLHNFPEGKAIKLQLENKPGALKDFKWIVSYASMIPELDNSWHQMSSSVHDARCFTCVPAPPTLSWVELELEDDKEKKQTKQKLIEDAAEAKCYEQDMKKRPVPVSAIIYCDGKEQCLLVQVAVFALMHRAAAELNSMGGDFLWEWRLRRLSPLAARPKFKSLKFHSNANMNPAASDLVPPLWSSQLKTLAWMMEKERAECTWNEVVLKETCIPSLGWCLEAKASRNPGVRGGVLADKVGAGKTRTTLELIRQDLQRLKQDDPKCFPHGGIGSHISTQATLILVPKNLIQQWTGEIINVMGKTPCLVLNNAEELEDATIDKFTSAEIILASLTLFEDEKYWEHHRMVACAPNVPEKAGRAFDEYLHDSLSNLATMIENSSDGTDEDAFWRGWREAKKSIGGFKRFSGVKTRASKKAEYKKARNTAATGGQKRTLSTTQSSANSPPRKKPKAVTAGLNGPAQAPLAANATTSSVARNEWVVISDQTFEKGEKADFDTAADIFEQNGTIIPVLHMFNFRRLVIDEFTYVQATSLAALLRMKATSRWLLSGTPPVHDYDAVNTIAKLLGTKLSAVDETNGVHGFVKGPKRDAKLKSLSEEFQEFQDVGSPAFLHHLYSRAQEFSDAFIRQDESSQAKKGKTHKLCDFSGNVSELLDYADVTQILETEDCRFNVKLDGRKLKDMAEDKIRQAVRQSRSGPRAALVCSMSDLATSQQFAGTSAVLDPQAIVRAEKDSILKNCDTLLRELQELWYCNEHAHDTKSTQSFTALLSNFENLAVLDLDPPVARLIDRLLSYAKSNPQMPASTLQLPKNVPKAAKVLKQTHQDRMKQAKIDQDAFKQLAPFYQAKEMDERTTKAERLIEAIVAGFRRVRFVEFAVAVNRGEELGTCSGCNSNVGAIDSVEVSGGCGHILTCPQCPIHTHAQDDCVDKYCSASVGHIWPSRFFSTDVVAARPVTNVSRMQKAIEIIEAIPGGEFALVFVQFANMAEQFTEACDNAGVAYADATSSKKASRTIEAFKEAVRKGRRGAAKVLLLQIDSEDAAGWNLQCANHVVFLAPFVGETEEEEWDTMVQAVGRAHRPGQGKWVVVYHIHGVDTIEAEMAEKVKGRFEDEV
ncbi:uncharacterized protein A1O9_04503 [Exophiala aquamarina CBS 119918]|uniref:Helicase ATP-binding domain-containing protein n=1 Tax=Exophiala aquamarina CBS 119918 TaxID=1182545 RepID=A0A072PIT1_9EURO|nr:uncharacterized protein A1O9_04503 [Exophiala aquamarina CBS 119918]KEF59657.1 hypothetical protein A1O9_04503 [Exophiala aquamarina CBS 119918]